MVIFVKKIQVDARVSGQRSLHATSLAERVTLFQLTLGVRWGGEVLWGGAGEAPVCSRGAREAPVCSRGAREAPVCRRGAGLASSRA